MGKGLQRLREWARKTMGSGLQEIAVRGSRALPDRRTFELTEEHLFLIGHGNRKDKGVKAVLQRGGAPNVDIATMCNNAWSNIARELRFDVRTVQPHPSKPSPPYFTAIPLPDDERDGGVIILSGR